MPTETGGETIGERLERLRASLANVRATISRSESNGAEARMGLGTHVTQVAYERAIEREKELEAAIARLERRLTGVNSSERVALLQTVMPTE
jgi:hypothetical protein